MQVVNFRSDRPSLDQTMLNIAAVLARRATCTKLAVGCVLTNRAGRIIGTGYNGVPHGMTHCTDKPCLGATMPAGSDTCEAVHAEQNALLDCRAQDVHTCYTTHAPCLRCTKLLLNTSCKRLVFPPSPFEGSNLWMRSGRDVFVTS